jgi:hypothetical protein
MPNCGANEILKAASAFFAAEPGRPQRSWWGSSRSTSPGSGPGPICRVLTQHGWRIAPSTYYDAARGVPSARARRDELLKAAISCVHMDNYGVYGAARTGGFEACGDIPPAELEVA